MQNQFIKKACELALQNVLTKKGGPFGAIVVKDDQIIATGVNSVSSLNDPTAHAEIVAIRNACKALNNFQLTNCVIYSSCEPCPMCFGAIFWARPDAVYYANTAFDAGIIGFDDAFIYEQLKIAPHKRTIPFIPLLESSALDAFRAWKEQQDKIRY